MSKKILDQLEKWEQQAYDGAWAMNGSRQLVKVSNFI